MTRLSSGSRPTRSKLGGLAAPGYNTGNVHHTLYVTFELDPPGGGPVSGDLAALSLVGMTG